MQDKLIVVSHEKTRKLTRYKTKTQYKGRAYTERETREAERRDRDRQTEREIDILISPARHSSIM